MIPNWEAANDFSFNPPIGKTLPRNVISPVIPILAGTGLCDNAEIIEVVNVTPAEGPSFGTAPSGTWIWIELLSKSKSISNFLALCLT